MKREVEFDTLVKQNSDGTDADELKLAIALSKSLSDEIAEKSGTTEVQETENGSKNPQNIKTILEQYGFKCKNNNTDFDLASILDGPKKTSKFIKRPTKLILTPDLQRQQILSQNIEQVLRENSREKRGMENRTNRGKIYSFYLKNIEEVPRISIEKTSFELDLNLLDNYYVQDLFFPSSVKCGSLLRNWKEIPGWDESPIYKEVSLNVEVDQEADDLEKTIVYSPGNRKNSSGSDLFDGCEDPSFSNLEKNNGDPENPNGSGNFENSVDLLSSGSPEVLENHDFLKNVENYGSFQNPNSPEVRKILENSGTLESPAKSIEILEHEENFKEVKIEGNLNPNPKSPEVILLDSSDDEDTKKEIEKMIESEKNVKEIQENLEESRKLEAEDNSFEESLESVQKQEEQTEGKNPSDVEMDESDEPLENVEFLDYEEHLMIDQDFYSQYDSGGEETNEEPGKNDETLLEIMEEDDKEDLDINMSISHILEATVVQLPQKNHLHQEIPEIMDLGQGFPEIMDLSQEDPKNDSLEEYPSETESDLWELRRDPGEPEPDYKTMNSSQLNFELKKFGLKNLPKKKAVSLLQFIYEEIHPKIKIVVQDQDKENFALDDTRNFLNLTDLATNINFKESDGIFKPVLVEDEEVILPGGRKTKKFLTCPVPLHIAFYNMVRSNNTLEMKILQCEKFNLDELLNHFKRLGTPYQESVRISKPFLCS